MISRSKLPNYPNDINIGTNVALLHTIKIHQISWSFFSHFIENKFLLNFKLNSKSETEEIFTLLKERDTSDSCPKYSGICVPKLNSTTFEIPRYLGRLFKVNNTICCRSQNLILS